MDLRGALWILMILTASAHANLLRNASFETVDSDGRPAEWHFYCHNGAEASVVADDSEAVKGERSLKITNRSPFTADVYGAITQQVPGIEPGNTYRLSFFAKSKRNYLVQFIMGNAWDIRFSPRDVTEEWKHYTFDFTPRADQVTDGRLNLVISSESVTDGYWVDAIEIAPLADASAGAIVIPPAKREANRVAVLPPVGAPRESWPVRQLYSDIREFSAELALGRSENGLVVDVVVRGATASGVAGENVWQHDSVLVHLDPLASRSQHPLPSDIELGLAPTPDGVAAYSWTLSRELRNDEVTATWEALPDGAGYRINAEFSWGFLRGFREEDGLLGFNMIVSGATGPGKERRMAYLVHRVHDPRINCWSHLLLLTTGEPRALVSARERSTAGTMDADVLLLDVANPNRWDLVIKAEDTHGQAREWTMRNMPASASTDIVQMPVSLNLDGLADGDVRLTLRNKERVLGGLAVRKLDRRKTVDEALAEVVPRLKALRLRLPNAVPPEAEMLRTVLERQVLRLNEDLEATGHRHYQRRLESAENIILPEMQQMLQRYEKVVGALEAGTYAGSNVATPSAFLGGYGHFWQFLDNEIPFLNKQGCSVLQFEVGPSALFPKPGEHGDFGPPNYSALRGGLQDALVSAAEHNQQVVMLLSPHYAPGWWLEKHPEVVAKSGFMPYEGRRPEAREMLSRHIQTVVAEWRNAPYAKSVHSICLSNEPVYTACKPHNAFNRSEFLAYLEKHHGTPEAFAARTGRHFGSFEAVADAAVSGDAIAMFEFNTFKRWAFADWHRWMAGEVRKVWPEIPVHVKIMAFYTLEASQVDMGVDPELFSEFSDLNGNDNYMFHRQAGLSADWFKTSFYHDLQFSFKPVGIVNAEAHVIADGDTSAIPYSHVYTATFEQYLTGVAALITWVWVPDSFREEGFVGNISRRPAAIVAQGMATLDANRLADEILAYRRHDPEIALLYSPTAYLRTPAVYAQAIRRAYETLCTTGYPVTFLSERQLQRGEFRNVKLLILPEMTNLDAGAAGAIQRFRERGGEVLAIGHMPTLDQYDTPLPAWSGSEHTVSMSDFADGERLRSHLKAATPRKFGLRFADDGSSARPGVFVRAVPYKDGELINLVNYTLDATTVEFVIPEGTVLIDLLSGENRSRAFDLQPLNPQLLLLEPDRE